MIDLVAVDSTYRHVPKVASPGPLLRADASRLKWYDVARADTPVPDDIREMARAFLVSEAKKGTLELDRDVGFTSLHRCGTGNDFYFFPVCTWRHANEMWESVYYKDAKSEGFAPFPQSGRHKGSLCVWELGPVIHEQKAWVKFLQSLRTERDLAHYLSDTFAGVVGA